jgi:hypothetical protein
MRLREELMSEPLQSPTVFGILCRWTQKASAMSLG